MKLKIYAMWINFYKDFENYFNKQWSPMFQENILVLKNINKKFHTNNSLENINRTFKRLYDMKENMNLITYVDDLVEIFMDIKIFYNKQTKKVSKVGNKHKNNKKHEDIKSLLNISLENDSDKKEILNEILSFNDDNKEEEKSNNNYKFYGDMGIKNNSSQNLRDSCWLKYTDHSCSFDSFLAFLYSRFIQHHTITMQLISTKIHQANQMNLNYILNFVKDYMIIY